MAQLEQVRHGKFQINREGLLSLDAPEAIIGFAWHASQASCLIQQDKMRVRMVVGRVPSTATSGAKRRACLAMLHIAPSLIPPACRMLVLADYRVVVEGALGLALPVSVVALLTALVSWVLAIAPFQDLMLAEGLEALQR